MSDVIGMLDRTTSAVENLLADFDMELLTAPTPCTEWTVSELLDHLVTGARMFASVASGNAPATDAQQPEPSDDPRLRYADARTEMVSAWRRRGLNGEVPFGPFGETPAQIVCTTAMWDHLTHGWDLAQAFSKPYHVDDDVLAVVWDFSVSFMTPDRRGPGQPLAPAVQAAPTASRLDQLMAFLGRQSLPTK
jgi:uncharacterized protein (TIGR03086 family)